MPVPLRRRRRKDLMGQVLSIIVRCVCGESEKDDPEGPIELNSSCLNRPLLFESCASDAFMHTIHSSTLSSSHSHNDSSPIGTSINPFIVDPLGDTFTIGSLHQNQTRFPQIVWDHPQSNLIPSSTLVHEPHLESLSGSSPNDTLVLTFSPSFESLSGLINIEEEEEEERQVSLFLSEENSIEPREEEKINKGVVIKERWMNDYCNLHKILLVGEGDFSFSASLALAFGFATNIAATSLNSIGFLRENYGMAMSNIQELSSRGSKVMHGVDATKMAKHLLLKGMKFDRIVFNFPHAGCFQNIPRNTQLRRHRKLVEQFLVNAKKMITSNGEIHVRHKSNGFFKEWNLELLGSSRGLRLIEEVHFNFTDYPGYHTKFGFGSDKNFNCKPSKTYKFGLP